MFVTAVSSISLAVFTNLSVMELDNAKLAQSQNGTVINDAPAVQASANNAPTQAADTGAQDSIQAVQDPIQAVQDSATASVWAKEEVKRHRERD